MPNFHQLSQDEVDVLQLPDAVNKQSPYWNSTSGFNFDIFTVVGVWLCTGLPLFVNWMIADGVMTSYWFYKMAAVASQIYFRFLVWSAPTCRNFGRNKAISVPNFDQISQSAAEKLLLPVSENKRSPSWNSTSGAQKALRCAETGRLSHKAWQSVQRFDLGAGSRKKERTGQSSQKVTKVLYFTYFRRSPHWTDFHKNFTVFAFPDVITCAKVWAEIFRGYDFTGGRISRFPIDSFMGLTTVQRYCTACNTPNITKTQELVR